MEGQGINFMVYLLASLLLQEILAHNGDESQNWKMGVNKFTDMVEDEFAMFKGMDEAQVNTCVIINFSEVTPVIGLS